MVNCIPALQYGILCAMDNLKKIMYGVTDFARMRAENGYFVDRTGLIRELEKTSYAMFLRPRRFGKSLLCSILQAYYDADYVLNQPQTRQILV